MVICVRGNNNPCTRSLPCKIKPKIILLCRYFFIILTAHHVPVKQGFSVQHASNPYWQKIFSARTQRCQWPLRIAFCAAQYILDRASCPATHDCRRILFCSLHQGGEPGRAIDNIIVTGYDPILVACRAIHRNKLSIGSRIFHPVDFNIPVFDHRRQPDWKLLNSLVN